MKFANDIRNMQVEKGSVGVFWAGQAGFILKTAENELIGIDLYLSDCCNRYFGFKRILPYLLEPHDLEFDYIISSHAHYDHFDVDAMPMLMSEKTKLLAACDVEQECERLGIKENAEYIKVGDKRKCGSVKVTAMPCDHGADTPDAIGLLIEAEGVKIYIAGDTCYREDYFKNSELKKVDLLIGPINGAFGNMDSKDLKNAAKEMSAKLTVPCHFWNFCEHYGNPGEFIELMKADNVPYYVMRPGEGFILTKNGKKENIIK